MSGAGAEVRVYHAFGLCIHSSLALWPGGAAVGEGSADVVVSHSLGDPGEGRLFSAGASDTAVTVPSVGKMSVLEGERIDVVVAPDASLEAAAVLAAGAGLGMALTQRGWFVLHGSSFRVGENGICVAGMSGMGKSTILAEMQRRGHLMIADGMTPLRVQDDQILALPGPPILKVWPNTAREMGWDEDSLQPISAAHDKRFRPVAEGVAQHAVPVQVVLSALAADPIGVAPLEPRQALMELVKQAFLMEFSDAESGAVFLRQAADVSPKLRVARLSRGTRFSDLSRVAAVLEGLRF